MSIKFISVFLIYFVGIVLSLPLPQQELPPDETVNFMKQFGYLTAGPDSDTLYTEEGFRQAVMQMQKFGGLQQTGELDNETLSLTKAPRCGLPDIVRPPSNRTKRYIIGSEGWRKKTLSYFLANWPPALDPEVTFSRLKEAFKMWSEISPLHFVPRRGMDADLIVAFGRGAHGDGYPFDGPGRILAHAFFPYEHGPYGGDIHFDDDEPWIDGAQTKNHEDGVDFFTVATHEIGHSLGLAHSAVPGSIMFPYYKGYNKRLTMDYDDVVAMYEMYVVHGSFDDEVQGAYPKDNDDDIWATDDASSDDSVQDREGEEQETEVGDTGRDEYPDTTPEDESNEDSPLFPDDTSNSPDEGQERKTHDSEEEDNDEDSHDEEVTDEPPFKDGFSEPDEYDERTEDKEKNDEEKKDEKESTEIPETFPTRNETKVKPRRSKIPDICSGSYDAASLIRGELFVFKELFMWRLKDMRNVIAGYPVYFHEFFRGFPWSVRSIDAVYQRPQDYYIVFFTGSFYWVFDGNAFTKNSPKPLTDLGLPSDLSHIDAALVWAKNRKTYLFSGDLYWRFNETSQRVEDKYPQRINRWKGAPKDLDAAFTWTDDRTYFFKEEQFWRFNNQNISVDSTFPLPAAPYWFDCPPPDVL